MSMLCVSNHDLLLSKFGSEFRENVEDPVSHPRTPPPFTDCHLQLLLEHQMSALRVVECIAPWFAALPLDKLVASSSTSSSQSSSSSSSSSQSSSQSSSSSSALTDFLLGANSSPAQLDAQLLLPLLQMSRFHIGAYGVASHFGIEVRAVHACDHDQATNTRRIFCK